MIGVVTEQSILSYRERGFVLIEDAFSSGEIRILRDECEMAVDHRLKSNVLHNQESRGAFHARVFVQCLRVIEFSDVLRDALLSGEMAYLLSKLSGVPRFRCWHDQALFKPGYSNPTAWHLDAPYWSFSSRNAISIWIALDDVGAHNGALVFLPGTHLMALPLRPAVVNIGIGGSVDALFDVYPEWRKLESVVIPCAAGSMICHNGLTAHAAGCNMTNAPRRALACSYMPTGSRFNGRRNILSEAYLSRLSLGDVLDDDVELPLLSEGNVKLCQ
jgi:ectoine hydroxylase-related dioxygenase (phytanoyl-CoA dioxygenase family)